MKSLLFIFLILFMSFKNDPVLETVSNNNDQHQLDIMNTNQLQNGYKYFEFTDQEFNIQSIRVQLPNSWKWSNTTNYLFEGPNGMRIAKSQNKNGEFTYPMDINQILETYYIPNAQNGGRVVNIYELPKIAKKSKTFLELNYASAPIQYQVNVYAVEWQDNTDMRYITILQRVISSSHGQRQWFFISQHAEASSQYYNTVKNVFINALLSEQHNTDWIFRKNQIAAQKINQSWQAHNARMNAIRLNSTNASFTSSTSSTNVGNIYSDILDINHSGYLKRSNMTSYGQTKTIRGIRNTTVISNHSTGEYYSVQAGSKYYWVNNNGLHFGTDNPNYDPRSDNRINNTEWSQFQIEH